MDYKQTLMSTCYPNDIYSLIKYDYPGLLGVETATAYWGLSTFNIGMPIFMMNYDALDNNGYIVSCALSTLFVPNVNKKNVVQLSEHLFITDREQTVVDMLRYNRHEFHLYETVLSAYEDPEVNLEKLEELASLYEVAEKLHKVYELALETEGEG